MVQRQLASALAAGQAGGSGLRQLVVGLVGRGIQASRTPRMHEREGRRIGIGYTYVLIDFDSLELADGDLGAIVQITQALGFAGLNVTFPFKQSVLVLLDNLAPEAEAIGAANTIVFTQGRRIGHNTDCWGFAESFREGLPDADVGVVVQFGAGGAGAAVGHALLSLGARALILCETDVERAHWLAERLSAKFGATVQVEPETAVAMRRAGGVVNTTPIGMDKYPGLPFAETLLRPAQWVADVIYFPPETALLAQARALGCRTLSGTGMAVYQAVKAFELFTGIVPDRAAMTAHFEAAA